MLSVSDIDDVLVLLRFAKGNVEFCAELCVGRMSGALIIVPKTNSPMFGRARLAYFGPAHRNVIWCDVVADCRSAVAERLRVKLMWPLQPKAEPHTK